MKNQKVFINNSIILLKRYLLEKLINIVYGIVDSKNDLFRVKIDIFVKVKWRPKNNLHGTNLYVKDIQKTK